MANANRLPVFTREGLRVVPYYGGASITAWQISVKVGAKQIGIDVGDRQFADDGALSVSLYKLNNRLAREGRPEVTLEAVRALA